MDNKLFYWIIIIVSFLIILYNLCYVYKNTMIEGFWNKKKKRRGRRGRSSNNAAAIAAAAAAQAAYEASLAYVVDTLGGPDAGPADDLSLNNAIVSKISTKFDELMAAESGSSYNVDDDGDYKTAYEYICNKATEMPDPPDNAKTECEYWFTKMHKLLSGKKDLKDSSIISANESFNLIKDDIGNVLIGDDYSPNIEQYKTLCGHGNITKAGWGNKKKNKRQELCEDFFDKYPEYMNAIPTIFDALDAGMDYAEGTGVDLADTPATTTDYTSTYSYPIL
uniref:Plasmodium falciparum erythrocyte membrane protein-1 N-terminal segment domain-containing protein n=1 Tax=Florenciella sp. virus SA2 TaxID=3240092 RepID=A0AB39JES1_9VIRU